MKNTRTGQLVNAIVEQDPGQAAALDTNLNFLSQAEADALEQCIAFLTSKGLSIEFLASAYNLIVSDTLAEQVLFMKTGTYRHATYAEVADAVYQNPEYMTKYMYGLMLTGFLWKNHVVMNRWYEEQIPRNRGGRYLEIGPGHGYHMLTAMRLGGFESYEGVDISPTSVALTQAILAHFLPESKQKAGIYQADFLEHDFNTQYDAVVMGEVLEHVEQPGAFLGKIRRIAKSDAFVYITTVINAPAVDHIYLFDSPQAVEQLVEQAGFAVKHELLVPYRGVSIDKSMKLRLPVTIALVIA